MRGRTLVSIILLSTALTSCASIVYPLFSAEKTAVNSSTYDAAFSYQNGVGVPRDYAKALKLYKKSSNAGDARADNNLGVMAMRGEGQSVSTWSASSYFQKAADKGSAAGHFNLALMYDNGIGMSHNPEAAVIEYRMASEMGLAVAQYRLGVMFENGIGTERNLVEARRLYQMASIGGVSEAQAHLQGLSKTTVLNEADLANLVAVDNCATCVGSDAETAMAGRDFAGLRNLALKGDPSAQYNLAVRLLKGDHAVQDPSEAARLFTIAARNGYGPAQRQLAQMHLRGQAVAKSKVLAHAWMNLASKSDGSEAETARRQMEELELSMTESEVSEAQKTAADWYSKGR